MNPPRHDMYTAVHKGLRARLFESARRLAGCNFADPASRDAALAHATETLGFLDEHAAHEDRFVQPRLADASRTMAERVAQTHRLVEQTGAGVAKRIAAIRGASPDVAVERGQELCRTFNDLVAQHVAHMNDEETLANAALWQTFTDGELHEVQGALQGSIAPPRFAEWMHVILPALNLQERVGMLSGMRAAAPPEVFEAVMQVGREAVGDGWGAVEEALR